MHLLQRYVLRELLAVAILALVSLTFLLMSGGVIVEARKAGLGPAQILMITPFLIPGTLPYTIPLSTLFAVTTVYGRMSGSGEIIAIKAAGIRITAILWPVFLLGGLLSVGTLILADRFVPWARAGIRTTVLTTLEDVTYDVLRTRRVFHDSKNHIRVAVKDVLGRRLIEPTFFYRTAEGSDVVARAKEATLELDHEEGLINIRMRAANVMTGGQSTVYIDEFDQTIALPGWNRAIRKKPQDFTIRQIRHRVERLQQDEAQWQARYAMESALAALTRLPDTLLERRREEKRIERREKIHREIRKFETEKHSRIAMSFSCFFFVMLGAPVAIWGQRSDFMGNFFLCILTILFAYYPIALLGMNLCKEGIVEPWWMMWTGNALLGTVGAGVLRWVLRH